MIYCDIFKTIVYKKKDMDKKRGFKLNASLLFQLKKLTYKIFMSDFKQ